MSLWDSIGDVLVSSVSEGTATLTDAADAAAAPLTGLRVVVAPQREQEALGLEGRDQLVLLSGAALGSTKITTAKRLKIGGVPYRLREAPDIGIRDPGDSATGNAPIVRAIISPGGR